MKKNLLESITMQRCLCAQYMKVYNWQTCVNFGSLAKWITWNKISAHCASPESLIVRSSILFSTYIKHFLDAENTEIIYHSLLWFTPCGKSLHSSSLDKKKILFRQTLIPVGLSFSKVLLFYPLFTFTLIYCSRTFLSNHIYIFIVVVIPEFL